MNARDYQLAAARTLIAEPGFDISGRDMMILWCAIGLGGEAGEVLELARGYSIYRVVTAKMRKELGDCMWYCAGECTSANIDMQSIMPSELSVRAHGQTMLEMAADLSIASGRVLEIVKKGILHRHGLDPEDLSDAIRFALGGIARLCWYFHTDIGDVMQENIDKLLIRYPNGYNSGDSVKRVDVNGGG